MITKRDHKIAIVYYLNDGYHSPHRPAIVYSYGEKVYYQHNKEHNIVGPSRTTLTDNRNKYRINGTYL